MSAASDRLRAIAAANDLDPGPLDAAKARFRAAYDSYVAPVNDLTNDINAAVSRYQAANARKAASIARQGIAVSDPGGPTGIHKAINDQDAIVAYGAYLTSLVQAQIDDYVPGPTTADDIVARRARLVAGKVDNGVRTRYFLQPWSIDNTGATDVTTAMAAYFATATGASSTNRHVLRARAGTYLMDATLGVTKAWTTWDTSGFKRVTSPIVNVTNVICNGTNQITRTGGAAFPAGVKVGYALQMRATDGTDYPTSGAGGFRGTVTAMSGDRKTGTLSKAHIARTGTATFVVGGRGTSAVKLIGCTDFHLTGTGEITGAIPTNECEAAPSGNYPWPHYYPDLEAQHGIEVSGGARIEIDTIKVHDVYGDCCYLGAAANGTTPADQIHIHDVEWWRAGREIFSTIGCTNVELEDFFFHDTARNFIDAEPTSSVVNHVHIHNGVFQGGRLGAWFAAVTGKQVDNVTIESCEGRASAGVGAGGLWVIGAYGQMQIGIGSVDQTSYHHNVVIRDNKGLLGWAPSASLSSRVTIYATDGLTFTGNVQPLPAKSGGVKTMTGLIGGPTTANPNAQPITGTINISGNTIANGIRSTVGIVNGVDYPPGPNTFRTLQGFTVAGSFQTGADAFRTSFQGAYDAVHGSGGSAKVEDAFRLFPQDASTSTAIDTYPGGLSPLRHRSLNLKPHTDAATFGGSSNDDRAAAIASGAHDDKIEAWADAWEARVAPRAGPLGYVDFSVVSEVNQGWTSGLVGSSKKALTFANWAAMTRRWVSVAKPRAPHIRFTQVWSQSGSSAAQFGQCLNALFLGAQYTDILGIDWYATSLAMMASGMAGDTIWLPVFEQFAANQNLPKCMTEWGAAGPTATLDDGAPHMVPFLDAQVAYLNARKYLYVCWFQADAPKPDGLGFDKLVAQASLANFAGHL